MKPALTSVGYCLPKAYVLFGELTFALLLRTAFMLQLSNETAVMKGKRKTNRSIYMLKW
jgi:hypothetical protein